MAYRGAHQRRRPWAGRADLNLADILLGFAVEAFLVLFLLAAVFAGR